MKRLSMFTLTTLLATIGFASAAAAAAPDFQTLGFPTVVAEKMIDPAKASVITYGNVNLAIPEGTFTSPVKFQVIEGPLADFQKKAPAGETVLMDFAFKVTDTKTNELVGKFNKPLIFSYTDANINSSSKYYDTAQDGTFSINKVPAKIEGTTLSHPVGGAGVGWAVTSPAVPVKNATSPVTGLAFTPWLATGSVMMIAGTALFVANRRRVQNKV